VGRVTVRTPHQIPERAPIRIAPGDQVVVGGRDTTWPAFVFVSTGEGEGWVPVRYLNGDEGLALVIASYDTTELPIAAGERLDVLRRDDESGWLWCRNDAGREGWVPISTVTDNDPGEQEREGK
jgi:hypothetical protein